MTDQTMAQGERGVAGGRDVINSIIVTGDHNQFFIGDYEHLRDAYIEPWSVFEQADLEHFVGREWLLTEVDAFLRGHERGYFILEAEAGLGKTTFLAWLVKNRGYIHHFTTLVPGQNGVERGLKNLAAQLMLAYGLGADEARGLPSDAASRPDYLLRLLKQAADKRQDGEKIVLVVDALDEAGTPEGHNALGLPPVLPKGIFVIASQRPVSVLLHVDPATTPRETFTLTAGSDENRADMRRFLESATARPKITQALKDCGCSEERFITTLLDKSGGVWIYLHYVVHEMEEGMRSPLDLAALPEGITRYYLRYWQQWRSKNDSKWHEVYLPLLSTLAAVRHPISDRDLATWAEVELPAFKLRGVLNTQWRPYLVVTGSGQKERYRFYHATLYDFVEGQVKERLPAADMSFIKELRLATIEARRRVMQKAEQPEVRRDAAFQLTRTRWFDYVEGVSPDEMLTYLDLIACYTDSPTTRRYLADSIVPILDITMPDRQRAQLLVYRAAMLAQLVEMEGVGSHVKELDEAEDCYKKARRFFREAISSENALPEDRKLLARITLGLANIKGMRSRSLEKEEEQSHRQKLLEEALDLYLEALQAVRIYGQDHVLVAGIHTSLGKTYTALARFEEAEQSYDRALQLLAAELLPDQTAAERYYRDPLEVLNRGKGSTDTEAFVQDYARILENASFVHWEKGRQSEPQNSSQALSEYKAAYELAQKSIAMLEKYLGESEALAIAHLNAGDYLQAMSKCPENDPYALSTAREHWQIVRDMAERLHIPYLEDEIAKLSRLALSKPTNVAREEAQ